VPLSDHPYVEEGLALRRVLMTRLAHRLAELNNAERINMHA
jgi:hypothetical protein